MCVSAQSHDREGEGQGEGEGEEKGEGEEVSGCSESTEEGIESLELDEVGCS